MIATLRTLLVSALILATAACKDATGTNAELRVTEDTVTMFAMNGSHPAAPVAFSVIDGTLRVLNSSFAFDVAVDLNAQNRIVLYPASLVASSLIATSLTAIQRVPENWSAVTKAPTSGYRGDSAVVLGVGEVAVVQVRTPLCTYALRGVNVHAKFVVDSVIPDVRRIHGRLLFNPNCGFRSLVPGIPKD